jgi:3-hydroxyisobutyrate dehydrogenase
MTEKIAFIGTGLIGGGLAHAAARRGLDVTAWNRSLDKARALEPAGVKVAETAAAAVAGAARVHVTMSDDDTVEAVLASFRGALAEGAPIVDHTTANPDRTGARARALAAEGVAYLHAPVFMSPQMCRDATGLMLAAGPKPVYDRVAEALAGMTGRVAFLGEAPHRAAAFKLFGNAMILTVVGGFADVLAMGKAQGIEGAEILGLFEQFDLNNIFKARGAKMAAGDYRASFELSMARKDARLMMEAAHDEPLAVLPGVAARMDTLLEEGLADRDLAVLSVKSVPERVGD